MACHFLDLPIFIRELIYDYAGLTNNYIDLNFKGLFVWPKNKVLDAEYDIHVRCSRAIESHTRLDDAGMEAWEHDDPDITHSGQPWCQRCSIPPFWSLRLVCRQVSQEVQRTYYSTNKFRVCQGNLMGFSRLWCLSDTSLSFMTSLLIRLDVPQSHMEGGEGWDECMLPTPIDPSRKLGRNILAEWTTLLDRLGRVVKCDTLSLFLVFRAVDIQAVQSVLEPMSKLPWLQHCGIWIGTSNEQSRTLMSSEVLAAPIRAEDDGTRMAGMSNLVCSTIKRLTSPAPLLGSGFPYLDLPAEIRYLILEKTDLVSTEPVPWRPQEEVIEEGISLGCDCIWDLGREQLADMGACCCRSDYNYDYEYDSVFLGCCGHCNPYGQDIHMCYCSSTSTARSTSCRCYKVRHPLFSTSSQIRTDAYTVYYTKNRFVISSPKSGRPYRWDVARDCLITTNSELSLYLSSISRKALQHIRWLEWELSSFCLGRYFKPRSHSWFDYVDTLLLMEHSMNLANFTFLLNMSRSRNENIAWDAQWDARYDPLIQLHSTTWKTYQEMVLPFQRLAEAGLKDFFVYVTPDGASLRDRKDCEQRLERAVMGRNYDSTRRGKPENGTRRYRDLFPRG